MPAVRRAAVDELDSTLFVIMVGAMKKKAAKSRAKCYGSLCVFLFDGDKPPQMIQIFEEPISRSSIPHLKQATELFAQKFADFVGQAGETTRIFNEAKTKKPAKKKR